MYHCNGARRGSFNPLVGVVPVSSRSEIPSKGCSTSTHANTEWRPREVYRSAKSASGNNRSRSRCNAP